jgi:3-hydroxy-3-methylglutaryl CoA synthase
MSGIAAYGAYVPTTRLPLALISGRPAKEGGPEKAVAYYDEDSVTLAVGAALDCLTGFDRSSVDALYFASTTYPLAEKQGAALIAKALDLRRNIATLDLGSSLRAGFGALEAGLNAVASGAARNVLVIASDCRMGAPRGGLEAKLGDGAAAFLISDRNPVATLECSASIANELQDLWRIDGERFTHTWEDRFVVQEGYTPVATETLRALLEKSGLKPGDFSRAALYTPDEKSGEGVARKLGFKAEQLQDPLFGRLGNTGAAFAPMLLVAALETAKAGQRILALAYGDGAQALALQVTDRAEKLEPRRAVSGHLARRRALRSYDSYLRSRSLEIKEWDESADLGLSATIRFRERDADIALLAGRCKKCGQLALPRPRVCIKCRSKDEWEWFRLSDKRGRVLSYTFDSFFPAPEPPTIMAMTDVEGCRLNIQLADVRPEEVKLDMPVEYVFRKIHDAGGKPNYFWKARPAGDKKS